MKRLHWYIFYFFLVLILAFESSMYLATEEGLGSAVLVYSYILLVGLLILCLIFILGRASRRIANAMICVFIALSIFLLKASYYDFMAELTDSQITLGLAVVAILLYYLFSRLEVSGSPTATLYIVLIGVLVAVPFLSFQYGKDRETLISELSASEQGYLENLSSIRLKEKPNVFILSYDSLITASTARRYLGIENLEYASVLDEHFIDLGPSATISVPSRPSLNGFMRLDQKDMEASLDYFSGLKPSPLGEIFSSNGYEVTTGFTTYYFGEKGPHVDGYITSPSKQLGSTAQCNDPVTNLYLNLRAFGVCQAVGNFSSVGNWIDVVLLGKQQHKEWVFDVWPSMVLDEIRSAAASDAPQLKIFYTYRPNGHTPRDYRHTDPDKKAEYRSYFLEGASMMANIFEDLVKTIRTHDPSALVVLFGDHGAWLSRGADMADDPVFFLEDRHVVYTAVMATQHRCAAVENLSQYSPGYSTPSRVVSSIIRCLSGDARVDKMFNFSEPEEIVHLLKSGNIET